LLQIVFCHEAAGDSRLPSVITDAGGGLANEMRTSTRPCASTRGSFSLIYVSLESRRAAKSDNTLRIGLGDN
jgi:hypothetical protein